MALPASQFGLALKAAREEKGLTRAAVAVQVGVDPMTLYRWERGLRRPPRTTTLMLAALYGRTASEFGEEESGIDDVSRGTTVRPAVGEVTLEGYAPSVSVAPRHARNLPLSVREYLAEFHVRLVKGGASEDEIDEAMGLLRSPDVFSYFKGGKLAEYNEEDVLDGMRSLAEDVVIPRLQKLGRKVK